MKRIALSFALAVLPLVPVAAMDPWPGVVKKVEPAIVSVENADGACTGFVIDTARKYVLTAAHCDGKELYADRVSASVVSKDTHKDLLVLKVAELDPGRTALKLAETNPAVMEQVVSVGYGYALERMFYRSARITDTAVMIPEQGIGGPFIGTDAPFIGGQSGGPIVNVSGAVVAIVQRSDGSALGIGVGAEIIKERVGRFFAQEQTK